MRLILLILATVALPVRAETPATTQPAEVFLLHLPGIGGYQSIDRTLLEGLHRGGITGTLAIYDWTEGGAGLKALYATERNQAEARHVAAIIMEQRRTHPDTPIHLTAHSGGTGIAVWALEQLPADVSIDSLTMLAPALSPSYDLADALKHVNGYAYVFYSPFDPVLGAGTWLFRTIDGLNTEAAGKTGFFLPDEPDFEQYRKLVQFGYRVEWMRLGHIGDHISMMSVRFSSAMIAPLILTRQLPADGDVPAPATTEAVVP